MKNFYSIIILLAVVSLSCKKDNSTTHTVTYEIIENVPGSSPYSVRYSLSDGTLRSEGPINKSVWTTENYAGFKKGVIVSLYMDAPNGNYELYIYVDNNVSSHATADGGTGEQLLEAQIPN